MSSSSREPGGRTGLSALSGVARGAHAELAPRPRSRWMVRILAPLIIVVAAVTLFVYAGRELLTPVVDVIVAPVIARPAAGGPDAAASAGQVVQAPGWVEPAPHPVIVPALVDGVLREVMALEGDRVQEGQVLARLFDEEYAIAHRLSIAVRAERAAEAQQARAGAAAREAAVDVAQAEVAELQSEVDRKRELVAAGGVSPGEFERLEIRLRGAEARMRMAQAEASAARAEVERAAAAHDRAAAAADLSALQLERTQIRAPTSGVILTRTATTGMRIALAGAGPGEAHDPGVFTMYDPDRLQVRVDVPLADAGMIDVGDVAEITCEAAPGVTIRGVVTRAVHEANIQRNTVQFKVAVEDAPPVLKPEMLVRVRLRPAGRPSAGGAAGSGGAATDGVELLLPAAALVDRAGDSARVWVVDAGRGSKGMVAAMRDLLVGADRSGEVVAQSGVRLGDRVVINPPDGLKPGARVRVVGEASDGQAGN